ncbi:TetR/AcrR family transcriptional regulator [Treponema sp. OMZ 840]|uniref:TetR/AcrR family transcriptional regulator n=1 Tax=Treponema sp. OMZ 840 TaxID=244313 RepID=UPI003D8A58F3
MSDIEKNAFVKKAEYRSAARSRRLIRDAYVSLMQKKTIDKISISDIVRTADLNRGTFYAHYSNPMDVLMEIVDEIVGDVQGFLADFDFADFLKNPDPLLIRVEALLTANLDFYRRINLNTASIGFTDQIKKILIDYISSDKTVPEKVRTNPQFEIALELFAGGLISVYLSFVQGQMRGTVRQITETVSLLIREASASFFIK